MTQEHATETVPPFPPPSRRFLAQGTLIGGRYEVRGVLGRGGHATVYRVWDQEVGREVALKLLDCGETPKGLVRLRREVRVARDAASPRLVRIYDLGSASQGTYITMEVVDGLSLKEVLREGSLPIKESIRITRELFEGLAALHSLAIVHHDVKPGNVLLTRRGEVKLADFGLSRRLDRDETEATEARGVAGTLGYLSPEQARGEKVGPASDLYSAGLLLFEILTGRLPYEAESPLAHLHLAPLDPRELRPEIPAWLARLIRRLLAKNPENRYQSAGEVERDLRAQSVSRLGRPEKRRIAWAAGVMIALLGFLGFARWGRETRFSHLAALGPSEIAAIGTRGETLWKRGGITRDVVYQSGLARLERGAKPLLGIVIYPPDRWTPKEAETLSFLDPDTGKVVRRIELPSGADRFPEFANRFHPDIFFSRDLNGDGVEEIVITYIHSPEWPSFTVLYEPRLGRSRVMFYGSGHHRIVGAEDLDHDGRPELLLAGINNRLGWWNVLAAVRLTPWIDEGANQRDEPAASPDIITSEAERANLFWYALLPRGRIPEGPRAFRVNRKRRTLFVRYENGQEVVLGYDGFAPGTSRSSSQIRQAARAEALRHLREAIRLSAAEAFDASVAESGMSLIKAREADEPLLEECLARFKGKFLVAAGHLTEGERLFDRLARQSENASEIAFDAGEALHLRGELLKAVQWYRRGIGLGGSVEAGKSKQEFLKGQVLALVESGSFDEAMEAVDVFKATYPSSQDVEAYREYARWRRGEQPWFDQLKLTKNNIDLLHYWKLEFEYTNGKERTALLKEVDRELKYGSEMKAELLSLCGVLLSDLGRKDEALDILRQAFEIAKVERTRDTVARAHFSLIAERLVSISEARNR